MEEKLYFKPAKYGKGIKNQKEKTEKKDKDEKGHRVRNLIVFLIFIAAIVLMILWLLHGKTTTSGQYPENIKNESLQCVADKSTYFNTPTTALKNRELKISAIFNGVDFLSSINLSYTVEYEASEQAVSAEAISHADFNRKLGRRGYNAGKFNNKFTLIDNKLIISLYAISSDLNEDTGDFFFIEKQDPFPKTLDEYRSIYENQGFNCTSSTEN